MATATATGGESKKEVFVTVGTTSFDKLVAAVDSAPVKHALLRRGFSRLRFQIGRGTYTPSPSPSKASAQGQDEGGRLQLQQLQVDYFTFSPSIADHLNAASLVISHAGSGSIFETLRLNKPLVVVVNEDLMDNHQAELAEELANRNHLFFAPGPHLLAQTIESMNLDSLVPYAPGDPNGIAARINLFLL